MKTQNYSRRQFLTVAGLSGTGLFFGVPNSKGVVILYCIAGGILVGSIFYMGYRVCKLANDKLNPPPPLPPPSTNSPAYPPHTAPAPHGQALSGGQGWQHCDINCDLSPHCQIYNTRSQGLTNPNNGAEIIGYMKSVFQCSSDLKTWLDQTLEVWYSADWFVMRFGEQVEEGNFSIAPEVWPVAQVIGDTMFWRAKP